MTRFWNAIEITNYPRKHVLRKQGRLFECCCCQVELHDLVSRQLLLFVVIMLLWNIFIQMNKNKKQIRNK